jgi:hypothetical protein
MGLSRRNKMVEVDEVGVERKWDIISSNRRRK